LVVLGQRDRAASHIEGRKSRATSQNHERWYCQLIPILYIHGGVIVRTDTKRNRDLQGQGYHRSEHLKYTSRRIRFVPPF
jgi:hypothetical protein